MSHILEFTDLVDVPNTFSGYPGAYVKVNGDALAVEFVADDTYHSGTVNEIRGTTAKTSPVDADEMLIEDSAASFAKKSVDLAALKTYIGSSGTDDDAIHDNVANEITAITPKALVSAADEMLIEDSAASYIKKAVTLTNLKTYMSPAGNDTTAIHDNQLNEITAITPKTTLVDADEFILEDSEASFGKKAVTAANLKNYVGGSGTDDDAIHDNVANEITAITPKTTIVDADEFILEDSGASFVKKAVTALNLSNYMSGGSFLPLVGGTMTGEAIFDETGISFLNDGDPACDWLLGTSNITGSLVFFERTSSTTYPFAIEVDAINNTLRLTSDGLLATNNIYLDTASTPTLFLREAASATDYSTVKDSAASLQLAKTAATGIAVILLNPVPSDGTSSSNIRLFRYTTTTGASYFDIYKCDGTDTLQHSFEGGTGIINLCNEELTTSYIDIHNAGLRLNNNYGLIAGQEVGGTYRNILRMNTSDQCVVGNTNNATVINGSSTRPLYNAVDLALYSDIGGGGDIDMSSSSDSRIVITVKNSTGFTIAIRSLCYISGDSSGTPLITKTDADSYTTASKMLVCLPAAIGNGNTGTAVIKGVVSGFSSLTASYIQYVSTTSGAFTQTKPTAINDVVRVVGYAISSTEIFFDPDKTWVEVA